MQSLMDRAQQELQHAQSQEPPRKRRRGWSEDTSAADMAQMQAQRDAMLGMTAVPNMMALALPGSISGAMAQMQAQQAMTSMSMLAALSGSPAQIGMPGSLPSSTAVPSLSSLLGRPEQKKNLPPVAGVDGSWICSKCLEVNFRNRKACHKCMAAKEVSHSVPGDGPVPGDDVIDAAAGSALLLIQHLEPDMEFDKLRWKVAKIFRTAAVGLAFEGNVADVIDKYSDKAFGQLAASIGDRDWLPEIDLTLLLDTAVQQTFPQHFLAQAGPGGIEKFTLASYDRAFDDIRVIGLMWNMLQGKVGEGKKTVNKVYAALDESRRTALGIFPASTPGASWTEAQSLNHALPIEEKVKRFLTCWIRYAIEGIAKVHGGNPSSAISEENLCDVFQKLLKSGILPPFLSRELKSQGVTLPQPLPHVDEVISSTYQPFVERASRKQALMTAQRANRPKWAYCYYHYQGFCGYGDKCRYAHHESEVPPHMIFCAPWSTDEGVA